MKIDYSKNFSNITSEEIRYLIEPGDKLEVLLNKNSPKTETWTVLNHYIAHKKYHLGFYFESKGLVKKVKGFIMCRLSSQDLATIEAKLATLKD